MPRGVQRATAQAMLLCTLLLGLSIPAPIMAEASRDWRIRALDRLARHSILAGGKAEIEHLALGTAIKNISHYLVASRFRCMLSEAYFDLTDLSADGTTNFPRVLLPFARLYGWGRRHAEAFRLQRGTKTRR